MPERFKSKAGVVLGISLIAVVICFGTAILLLALGAYHSGKDAKQIAIEGRDFAHAAYNETLNNRSIGWERGAIDCETVFLDSDRIFPMPAYCLKSEVIAFYPPQMCQDLGLDPETGCGKSQGD